MSSNLPALIEPLTPPECDLRAYRRMPLDVGRLRDSKIVEGDPEAFRAALLLWCASWHQVPAASLPNDDVELSKLAGYGRVLSAWLAVKEGAMHGFVLCSDGRFYHPVVAEIANESWASRQKFVARSKAANDARHASDKDSPKGSYKEKPAKKKAAPTRSAEVKGSEGKKKKGDTPSERPAAPRGTRLPAAWFATEKLRAYASEKGFSDPEIDRFEDEFRTWWPAQPGQKGVKLDWDLTWMTWIQREEKRRDERDRRDQSRGGRAGAGGGGGGGARSTEALRPMFDGLAAAARKPVGNGPRR